VIGFLKAHGLDKDFKVNIEVNHATLAGHTFEHELACAVDAGMLGSAAIIAFLGKKIKTPICLFIGDRMKLKM